MSGFKDTFTKDQEKDDVLGYDDTAFYYFASSVLLAVVFPWTVSFIWNTLFPSKDTSPGEAISGSKYKYCQTADMQQKHGNIAQLERRKNNQACGWFTRLTVIILLWALLVLICSSIGESRDITSFDPFAILDVAHGADPKAIKKAYRKLSLIYHPDKNQDDPLAQSRFIQITKAYAALTDETAKRNYEKYGNPDGPTTTKVGIGLPGFLLEKSNQLMVLSAFFFLLLFVVPMTFICYYQRTKDYAANGVMIESLQFFVAKIDGSTKIRSCPELLAASAESRGMSLRPSDNQDMKPLQAQVVMHKKKEYNRPEIVKHQYLVWAHMQRLHKEMTPELREDSDQLLRFSAKITTAMIEIACMKEHFGAAQNMIGFRRSLIQGLDIKDSQLLQIPHFDEEILKHCHRGKNAVSTLTEFIGKSPEQRKGLATMDSQQLADIEAFCAHVTNMEVKAWVEVEDEADICIGDVATVVVQMERTNLQEGEAMGPVHAPLFPEIKYEEWWLFLVEAASDNFRIITNKKITSTERNLEEKLQFQVSRPGKHQLTVHMLCDSYAGLDQKVDINFNAMKEEEAKRDVFVHPEDEELDLVPTLFQQFMGELGKEDESDEEGEEEPEKKSKKSKEEKDGKKKDGEGSGKRGKANKKAKEDSEDEDDKKDKDDSESSAVSSDSD